ncbi:DUF559 domain-containing protein [Mycobacterium sp.]|uniref:endonuclease domain-containing protein n=1 Tax=Mycobacterium sp. TaxID=1785 RepID=UPI0031DEA4E3
MGSEALASGTVNRHQLRSRYRLVCPNVYLPRQIEPSLEQRIAAAWLWSGRRATIAGSAAAALHGAKWIDGDVVVELVHSNPRTPPGVVTRRELLLDDEVQILAGRAVTTPERTAFDLGRRGEVRAAVAQLDALARATRLTPGDVALLAGRHPRARGLRQLETALELVDPGAQSPRESYLRLLLVDAGFPRPQTQIPVDAGDRMYYLDMGWPEHLVAVEYDGDQHRTDRWQYVNDVRRSETLDRLGWLVVRVVAEDRPAGILRRVRQALQSRGLTVR